jgi:hypothetical protein
MNMPTFVYWRGWGRANSIAEGEGGGQSFQFKLLAQLSMASWGKGGRERGASFPLGGMAYSCLGRFISHGGKPRI